MSSRAVCARQLIQWLEAIALASPQKPGVEEGSCSTVQQHFAGVSHISAGEVKLTGQVLGSGGSVTVLRGKVAGEEMAIKVSPTLGCFSFQHVQGWQVEALNTSQVSTPF